VEWIRSVWYKEVVNVEGNLTSCAMCYVVQRQLWLSASKSVWLFLEAQAGGTQHMLVLSARSLDIAAETGKRCWCHIVKRKIFVCVDCL